MRSYLGILIVTTTLGAAPVGISFAQSGAVPSQPPPGSWHADLGGARIVKVPRATDDPATSVYNIGVRSVKKAQGYDAEAAKASTPEKIAESHDKAQESYRESVAFFIDAVTAQPGMYQAWINLGFADRHLGNYCDALSAYDRALEINPNHPDVIEYRGEAYLGLNRIEEAKGAYMALFRNSRPLADELMVAMHHWANARRQDAQGVRSADVDAFAKWMDERTGIAAQTSSLAISAAQPPDQRAMQIKS
jgi:tetratricopeptide (TPR) repeat protein